MIKLIILIIVATINIFLVSKYYVEYNSEIVVALSVSAVVCGYMGMEYKKEKEEI